MAALTAADIRAKSGRKVEAMEVPEWGGGVFVRSLTGTERDAFDDWLDGRKRRLGTPGEQASDRAVTGRFVALVLCDEKGVPLFREDDAATLGDMDGAALNRVARRGQEMSGLSARALEDEKGN